MNKDQNATFDSNSFQNSIESPIKLKEIGSLSDIKFEYISPLK